MRKLLLLVLAFAGLGLAWKARAPSVAGRPAAFAHRETVHDFDWASLGRTDVSGSGRSVATSFVGTGDYFSGPHSRVFYLGQSSELRGKFLIYYPDARRARHELRFYLDYRPITVQVRALPLGEWRETAAIEHEGTADGRNVFELVVPGLPRGRHDLAIVTRHADLRRPTPSSGGKLQEVPVLDQDIYVVQTVREQDFAPRVAFTAPTRSSPVTCKDRERYVFARGTDVAVVNCKLAVTRGVLFGAGAAPLHYELPAESSGVFHFDELDRVSHVGEPFSAFEDPDGALQDNHRDLVGL